MEPSANRFWVRCYWYFRLFAFESVLVQFVSDVAAGSDCFGVRRVADIDKADLAVFAVASSGGRLVFILEPVGADDIRIL